MMLENVTRYLALADRVFQIADSEAYEETKYELIFSDELSQALEKIFCLDYCDPDTSYAEDVAAYVAALREKCSELRKAFEGQAVVTGSDEHDTVVDLARQVAAETSATDSVGHLARLFARKIVRQHEELVLLRAGKESA